MKNRIKVSAPGRICLFGEHQDYLGLPVITAAIDLRLELTAVQREDKIFNISLPDIRSFEKLDLSDDKELEYKKSRDYFRSAYNVLLRNGLKIGSGYDCVIRSSIPINSGTSSSSALINVWNRFLNEVSLKKVTSDNEEIARLSYLAEVEEFGEPGGQMDQYATALGKILFIDFHNGTKVKEFGLDPGYFVLGDSKEPKDTLHILRSVKDQVLSAVHKIMEHDPEFSLFDNDLNSAGKFKEFLTAREYEVLSAAFMNKEFTYKALEQLQKGITDRKLFGRMLTEHHAVLDEKLKISTPKINRMIKAAISAGAYGGKINGSGGGGCMFVYAPDEPEKAAEAIEKEGGKAYIIKVSDGLRTEKY
jgi:galactokinase